MDLITQADFSLSHERAPVPSSHVTRQNTRLSVRANGKQQSNSRRVNFITQAEHSTVEYHTAVVPNQADNQQNHLGSAEHFESAAASVHLSCYTLRVGDETKKRHHVQSPANPGFRLLTNNVKQCLTTAGVSSPVSPRATPPPPPRPLRVKHHNPSIPIIIFRSGEEILSLCISVAAGWGQG